MSYGLDLLGQIANARAQLLLRGHSDPLTVIIGRATLERLNRQAWPYAPHENQIIDMAYMVRDDMEGWILATADTLRFMLGSQHGMDAGDSQRKLGRD